MEIKIKKDGSKKKKDVFISIITVVISAYIMPMFKIPVISPFLPFIFALFVCHYLLRYTLSEYTYYFGDKLFKIEHKTGYKTTELLNIPLNSVNYVKKETAKAKNLTVGRFDKDYLILSYNKDKMEHKVKIHNSEKILSKFNKDW